jgi:hypothetical protein
MPAHDRPAFCKIMTIAGDECKWHLDGALRPEAKSQRGYRDTLTDLPDGQISDLRVQS